MHEGFLMFLMTSMYARDMGGGRTGLVLNTLDFGRRGPWFRSHLHHLSLWPCASHINVLAQLLLFSIDIKYRNDVVTSNIFPIKIARDFHF